MKKNYLFRHYPSLPVICLPQVHITSSGYKMQVLIFSLEKASLSHFNIYPSSPYYILLYVFPFARLRMNTTTTTTTAVDVIFVWENQGKREKLSALLQIFYLLSFSSFLFYHYHTYIHSYISTIYTCSLSFSKLSFLYALHVIFSLFAVSSIPTTNHANTGFPY